MFNKILGDIFCQPLGPIEPSKNDVSNSLRYKGKGQICPPPHGSKKNLLHGDKSKQGNKLDKEV